MSRILLISLKNTTHFFFKILRAFQNKNCITVFVILSLAATTNAFSQPTFSKVFSPDVIGPGNVSTLTFTIDNSGGGTVTDLAFTDTLPAGVTIADPAKASTTCVDATLTAPIGGSTITFSDGELGTGSTCTVSVNVVGTAIAKNTSGDLTSSAGNSGTASDSLTVTTSLPGFRKSFSPSSINLGTRSVLTFTIDNTANAADVGTLDFTDILPVGMVIAAPSNAATDCEGPSGTTLTATPGTDVITLDADGSALPGFEALSAGDSCTVTIDVTGTGSGELENISGELLADFVSAGKASATLEVTVDELSLVKSFTDDPTPPGGTVTLEFMITNRDRDFSATSIAFDDTLDNTLTGLAPSESLPKAACDGTLDFAAGVLSLTGGSLAADGGSCTFDVMLVVPIGTTPGAYPDTTSSITGTVGGSPVTGSPAIETLFIESVPLLTKEFTDDPVSPGDDVTLRFTIENTSPTAGATDISFLDELTDGGPGTGFLPFPVSVTLPTMPCGAGSAIALVSVDTDREGLELTGGSLSAPPSADTTCTFDVTVTIPADFPAGSFPNTTEEITATVDGATVTGNPATDTLVVVAPPDIIKLFVDDPVAPGDTVSLLFTLTHGAENDSDAVDIGFTDDLTFLAGLAPSGAPTVNTCGGTLSGTTVLTYSGGTLTPGASCAINVPLLVPATAPLGSHTNTTGVIEATVGGLAVTGTTATDDLDIVEVFFTKEFIGDPVIAGSTVTLQFTFENFSPADDYTILIPFTDNLGGPGGTLLGLAATGPPSINTCGGTLTGTTSLSYAGGVVTAASSCSISVELLVPAGAADDTYFNTTSTVLGFLGTTFVILDPAVDALEVNSNFLELTKEFTDDPVAPGGTVNLEFKLMNLDPDSAISSIAFTDDLDATLTDLEVTGLPFGACGGGTVDAIPDSGTIDFSGGSLAAGDSCSFTVTLDVPPGAAAGAYGDTTSSITGTTLGGLAVFGDPATDDLNISLLSLSKAFDGPSVAKGTPKLTFKIKNLDVTSAVADLSFSDNLDDVISGLEATSLPGTPCGAGSVLSGTSLVTMVGGSLAAGDSCDFEIDLLVPLSALPGNYLNTTSDLRVAGIPFADPATATLTINPPPNVNDKITPVVPPESIIFDFILNQFKFDLALKNTNGGAIFVPVLVRFTDITTIQPDPPVIPPLPEVTVNNADFGGNGVGSGFDYSSDLNGDDNLANNETSEDKTWIFDDPGRADFTFTADVFGNSSAPGSFAKSNNKQSFMFRVEFENETMTIETIITDVEEPVPVQIPVPTDYALHQNYPNPFNPETSIRFQLPEASVVVLNIYNLKGQLIRKLIHENIEAGFHKITWDSKDNFGNNVPSGIYLYRLHAGKFTDVKKLMLIR